MRSLYRSIHKLQGLVMIEPEEQVLLEVLQWLTLYFVESRIKESSLETQLAENDQSDELAEEEKQDCEEVELFEEKNLVLKHKILC